ncbi:MAG: AtpZ/AtpI family protein [Armatimonadota bacterium]
MRDQERQRNAARTAEGLRSVAVLSGAGFTLAAAVALGALGGKWLDHRFGTTPWLMVVGFLLGTIGGFMQLLRIVTVAGRK